MKKSFFALALILVLISGCPNGESGKYFEMVLQDSNCKNDLCFDEIFALEDGLVFMKQKAPNSDYQISFCNADKGKLNQMFSFLNENFRESRYVECTMCSSNYVYHLFYNNGKETKFSSIPVQEEIFEGEFYEMAKDLCSGAREAELIHVIYGKKFEYFDYHIFSNNYVVFEKFGLRDGELLDSKVSKITTEEFNGLKSLIADDFFSSSEIRNCPANGYSYGYVEALIDGKHAHYFTCGDETAAGKLFIDLVREVS